MTRIANRDARQYVDRKEPFQGSNLYAETMPRYGQVYEGILHDANTPHGLYVVYSYGAHFPLYVFDPIAEMWFENKDSYSRSTTRHKSQARPAATTRKVTTGEMLIAARKGAQGLVENMFKQAVAA